MIKPEPRHSPTKHLTGNLPPHCTQEYLAKVQVKGADNGRVRILYHDDILGSFSVHADLQLADKITEMQWRSLHRIDSLPTPALRQIETRCRANHSAACSLYGFGEPVAHREGRV